MSKEETVPMHDLDSGSVGCKECGAVVRVYSKDLTKNRMLHDYPKYCMYCGKRLEAF